MSWMSLAGSTATRGGQRGIPDRVLQTRGPTDPGAEMTNEAPNPRESFAMTHRAKCAQENQADHATERHPNRNQHLLFLLWMWDQDFNATRPVCVRTKDTKRPFCLFNRRRHKPSSAEHLVSRGNENLDDGLGNSIAIRMSPNKSML